MKRLLIVLTMFFSAVALPAGAAENAALAEEAKKKWAQSEAKDTEFEEIMENVVDALSASHYMVNALMFKTKGDERGFETALENACTHGLRSPMTDDNILAICKMRRGTSN